MRLKLKRSRARDRIRVRVRARARVRRRTCMGGSLLTCMGAFVICASSTNFTICERALSLPTALARTTMAPFWLMVEPKTASPVLFGTGRGSPVI